MPPILDSALQGPSKGQTADGFELCMGCNHLGHFRLLQQLLPTLQSQVCMHASCRAPASLSGRRMFLHMILRLCPLASFSQESEGRVAAVVPASHLASGVRHGGGTAL